MIVGALDVPGTVEVERFGHRLALGVQWLDAGSGRPAGDTWATELETVGGRPLVQRLLPHAEARHALLFRDAAARLITAGVQHNTTTPPATPAQDSTNLALRGFGTARRYVPRRLLFTPVLVDGTPPATPVNIRKAWLWPGAASPYPANSTVLRGRVRRGTALDTAAPVPWARIAVTQALAAVPPAFADETLVGWGHGDDRGEFLVVLGARAMPGGALMPALLPLTVWVHLPPVLTPVPADPLAGLPLEFAGSATDSAVLTGKAVPPGYVRQGGVRLAVAPGSAAVLADADLLFSP
jgi:hypothetical protein